MTHAPSTASLGPGPPAAHGAPTEPAGPSARGGPQAAGIKAPKFYLPPLWGTGTGTCPGPAGQTPVDNDPEFPRRSFPHRRPTEKETPQSPHLQARLGDQPGAGGGQGSRFMGHSLGHGGPPSLGLRAGPLGTLSRGGRPLVCKKFSEQAFPPTRPARSVRGVNYVSHLAGLLFSVLWGGYL